MFKILVEKGLINSVVEGIEYQKVCFLRNKEKVFFDIILHLSLTLDGVKLPLDIPLFIEVKNYGIKPSVIWRHHFCTKEVNPNGIPIVIGDFGVQSAFNTVSKTKCFLVTKRELKKLIEKHIEDERSKCNKNKYIGR